MNLRIMPSFGRCRQSINTIERRSQGSLGSRSLRLICAALLVVSAVHSHSQETLNGPLAVFEPYLGTWTSTFTMGASEVTDISRWERALNGNAVRNLHSINEGVYGGETLIVHDRDADLIKFFYFTTAGFYTIGDFAALASGGFVARESVTGNGDGITEVESTSELVDDEIVIHTRYLKHGAWTEPETRRYKRSEGEVKFR